MTSAALRTLRLGLKKNQRQLSEMLGVSLRAIHSFEQGWRKIPVYVERQMLFLVMLARRKDKPTADCWKTRRCPEHVRTKCPAWELKAGNLCWFINGTLCQGSSQRTWAAKMEVCRRCKVFLEAVGPALPAE